MGKTSLIPSLRRALKQNEFAVHTIQRGREDFRAGRVEDCGVTTRGGRIGAKIAGPRDERYTVDVILVRVRGGGVEIDGRCTCAEGVYCRHIVATLSEASRLRPDLIVDDVKDPPTASPAHASAGEKSAATKGVPVESLPTVKPLPCLRFYGLTPGDKPRAQIGFSAMDQDAAHLEFVYHGMWVSATDPEARAERSEGGKLLRAARNPKAEAEVRQRLETYGLRPLEEVAWGQVSEHRKRDWSFGTNRKRWQKFALEVIPQLKAEGWHIELEQSFQFQVVVPEFWYTGAGKPDAKGWFGFELGVQLGGERVNLLPTLVALIQDASPESLRNRLPQLADDDTYPVTLRDGRLLPFPVARLRRILDVLIELYDPDALSRGGRLAMNKLRAGDVALFESQAGWRWIGSEQVQSLGRKLREFQGIQPVTPPSALRATLRPYQQEGLNWLQFLREHELPGILADDMGLGKTVQALAHLLIEKESGRADRPSLVIAPTSLMTNWRQEAERFAPSLRVLVSHGLDRREGFDKFHKHDLIVTSYALLARDQEVLLAHEFHVVLLDEAQMIKNARTLTAQVSVQLRARHRLCLTGTPVENHLGELWSLFHFLLPGFLGTEAKFRALFRTPIEKDGDRARQHALARRVRPFLLRRTKAKVAMELPPKTEVTHPIELSQGQRDLYESIRLAMHERVRAEIDSKGIERSRIVILDALLKLRQVCCDPRLVKLDAARAVEESAKFEFLFALLTELLDEGRKILLFSQFTSMLALIETELKARSVPYARLIGETVDRATPIAQFQEGKVPLFLISLRAGGLGLNLTAADTVILYDPWWNPAVEEQAAARAHRIGQTKPIFVYKLIAAGSVEERIVALQSRKRELAEGLFDHEAKSALALSCEELESLFEPLQ